MSKVVKLNNAIIWTDDSDILYCEFRSTKPNSRLESETAKLYIDAIISLCNGKAMPFLIDLREARGTFSVSAAKLIAKHRDLAKLRISESFVANSIGIKLLICTYKRLYDPITPFGIFNNIEDAKDHCYFYKNLSYGSI
jgi:hypothetical protein